MSLGFEIWYLFMCTVILEGGPFFDLFEFHLLGHSKRRLTANAIA